jgi:GT2 family glycosyltransferase
MKVSVCLASYNGDRFIEQQIDSILSQLGESDELIISDDNSTDSTVSIINKKADPRIRLFFNNKKGIVSNFENAIYHASGDLIFLADQDDIWKENKVKRIKVEFMDPDVTVVISNCDIIDELGRVVEKNFFEKNNTRSGFIANIIKNGFVGCCMAFKASLKNTVLPFPSNIPMHDSYIGLIASLKGKVIYEKDSLILHRKHGANNSSTSSFSSNQSILKKTLDRLILLYTTLKRHYFNNK